MAGGGERQGQARRAQLSEEQSGRQRAPATVSALITDRPLESLPELADLGSHGDGAVTLFQGRVRESNRGRRVVGLEYTAYEEMAERELRAIAEEAAAGFPVSEIAAAHRVGRLSLGAVSVAIAVAAPHRDACYAASRFVIEEVKRRLPIWKRESYADGTVEWVGAATAGVADAPASGPPGGGEAAGDPGSRAAAGVSAGGEGA